MGELSVEPYAVMSVMPRGRHSKMPHMNAAGAAALAVGVAGPDYVLL
jgi:hypothetical protein